MPLPLHLFTATDEDRGLGRAAAGPDTSQGWQSHCSQPVQVVPVPGTHISMLQEPHAARLAAAMQAAMQSAMPATSPAAAMLASTAGATP